MSLALFDVVKGRVTSLKEYGAFISIGHTGKQGLLHRSQISNHPVDRIEDVLENGEEVFCKVINMRDGRIGLSMRLVDQTTGRDKDPDNLIASRLEERRRGRPYESRAPISLGAVYETVCRNCGIRGHLASDCFHRPGSSRLGLVYSSDGGSSDGYDGPKGGSSRKFKRSDNAIRGSPNRMRRFNEYRPNDEGRSEYNRNYDSRKRKHTDQQHVNNFEYKRKQSPS